MSDQNLCTTVTRWATPEDIPALDAFLLAHADRAMFPLSNLRGFGVSGEGAPYACRFLLTHDGDALIGVVGVDQTGGLLPVGVPDLVALHRAMAGRSVAQLLGENALAERVAAKLSLTAAPAQMDDTQPHFTLSLDALAMPDTRGLHLGPVAAIPREQAIAWRATYAQEVLGDSPTAATERAVAEVANFVVTDSHRILFRGDTPVGMTGFNAALPEIVQIGGVFTPPALRGQGIARAAVALHLAQARDKGARRAVLFAASEPAAKAYRALGFERIGDYRIILYRNAPEVPPCP